MPKRTHYKYFKTQQELERFKKHVLPKSAYNIKTEEQLKFLSCWCDGYTLRYMVNKDK